MKRQNLFAILAVVLGLTASLTSCTNQDSVGSDASLTATATDEAQAATVSDQIVNTADEYANAYDANGYQQVSAAQKVNAVSTVDSVIITIDKTGITVFPKKMCIDFGTTGFTDKRGNVLKGKIYLTISARMTVVGSYREFVFSNFFVNDNSVKGYKKVIFLGLAGLPSNPASSVGYPSWSIEAKDTIVRVDGSTVVWNSERVRTLTDNNNTPLISSDDTYSITGSSNGVNAKGVAYTMVVDAAKPLVIIKDWKYFVSGAVVITTEKRTAVLDYGDGTKDAKATVTINGVTKEITLKK